MEDLIVSKKDDLTNIANAVREQTGRCAHVEGVYTIASGKSQHVEGVANIEDTADQYIHIAGNGVDPSNRSNAYTLDWSGNVRFAGDVVINGCSSTEMPISLKGINELLGSGTLSTEAQTILGTINELYALYNSLIGNS